MIRRLLWRLLLRLRFYVLHRHRYRSLVLESVAGLPILVLPDVFNPALLRSGEFLVRQVGSPHLVPPGSRVLDLGTGSGSAAVAAARAGCPVIAVDLNPAAVRCARINALLNGVEDRVEVRPGDLFGPVSGEQFDVVLFNPPFYRGRPRDALDLAWRSSDLPERFARELRGHLSPRGHALLVLSSDGEPSFVRALDDAGMSVSPVVERDLRTETMRLYRVAPC
jgi:HemK-related putative methylase